jgi:thymidine phosphorylase
MLRELVEGRPLSESAAESFFEALLTGGLDDAQIGAAVAMIQSRDASVDELVGAARAMRRHVTPVPVRPGAGEVVLDTCGTGGAAKTFNISTTTAIVIAAAEPDPSSGVERVAGRQARESQPNRDGARRRCFAGARGQHRRIGPEIAGALPA